MNVSVLIKFSQKTNTLIIMFSIKSYVLDDYSNRLVGEIHLYHFDSDPRFPPFLLYVRWKSGVTFVCFRDVLFRLDVWNRLFEARTLLYG